MQTGRSFRSDNWLDFNKGIHNFVEEDFPHEKAFVLKTKMKKQSNQLQLKESLSEKPGGVTTSGEVRYWLTFKTNRSFYCRTPTDSHMTVQYDNGIGETKGIKNNFYFGSYFSRKCTQFQFFTGIELFQDKKWSVNCRLLLDPANKALFIDQKFHYQQDQIKINGYSNIDIKNSAFGKCGLLFGYEPHLSDWRYYIRLERGLHSHMPFSQSLLSNITFNANRTVTPTHTLGLETHHNLTNLLNSPNTRSRLGPIWLCCQWKKSNSTIKAKINNELTHAISITNQLASFGSYSLGLQGSDIRNKLKMRFGVKVDLNF